MVHSRAPATLGVTIAVLITSSTFVIARFLSRGWIVKRIGIDDWLILIAWILAVGLSTSICYGTSVGLGRHYADVHEEWHVPLQKAQYAFSVLYNPTLMASKSSILLFFLSLTKEEIVFRWCIYIVLFVVNAAGTALTILSISQCHPVSAVFQFPMPTTAKCIDIVALYLASAPVNIITDLSILFLPMPILTRIRLPRKQKIILVVTFSFGIFVAAVDVVRIAYLQNASFARIEAGLENSGGSEKMREQSDFSWYASLSFMWSAVEVNVGIICACVPSLKALFLRFLPSFIRDRDDKTNPRSNSGSGNADHTTMMTITEVDPITNPAALARVPTLPGPVDENREMGFFDFLAMDKEEENMTRVGTNITSGTWNTNSTNPRPTFHDFVKLRKPKSMLRLSNRESFMPVLVVTILFLLWGLAYGFLNVLNGQFQTVAKLTPGQSIGFHASYFGGYFMGPLTLGQWMLKKYGFKATMISGLAVYGSGTLVFWPSAVFTSYAAYIISNIMVGFGLSCLEIAANPFIILCGPLEYAEIRLNLSQGVQAIGSVLSPLLAKKVLFRNVLDAPSLINVQWTYLGIAVFAVLLAVAIYYIPLPEASDQELDEIADRRSVAYNAKVGGKIPVIWLTLGLGVFSQFCYVGGQEAVATSADYLVASIHPNNSLTSFDYQTLGHTVFAVGRFTSAFLNYLFKPRWVLLGLYVGLIVTSVLIMSLDGTASIVIFLLIYFFESGVFSIIYAISIRGLGAHTKTGCALMTAAISGGAVFQPIQYAVEKHYGNQYSYCVVTAVYAFGTIFAIYLNLIPEAKRQVDPLHDNRHDRRGTAWTTGSSSPGPEYNAFGITGIMARYRYNKERWRRKQQIASRGAKGTTRHIEQGSQAGQSSLSSGARSNTTPSTVDDGAQNPDAITVLGQGKLSDEETGHVERGRERETHPNATQAHYHDQSSTGSSNGKAISQDQEDRPNSGSTGQSTDPWILDFGKEVHDFAPWQKDC